MMLKTSGMTIGKDVGTVQFDGRNCNMLVFTGAPEKVKHSYYECKMILFIDPGTFAMRRVRWVNEKEHVDVYIVMVGELNIGGIKMPQVKTCFFICSGVHRRHAVHSNPSIC